MLTNKISINRPQKCTPLNALVCPLLFALLLFITACEGDDGCDDALIPTTSLEELYGCSNTESEMEIDILNDFTIISDQATFESMVSGFCQPEIDFVTYDLIIGRQQLSKNLLGIDYFYRQACPSKRFELRVVLRLGSEEVTPVVTYHVLLPKIASDEAVDLRLSTE